MKCPDTLRDYIEQLKKAGEIQEIDQDVDWNLEIGAIMRRANNLKCPAPLFNKIKGYPRGFRVLGSPVSASGQKNRFYARIACSLGLPCETPASQLIETLSGFPQLKPVPPVVVPTGPCKENIMQGGEVDLFRLPVPLLHDGDGGRYIGTWHTVVTRAPQGQWTNWGMYRIMVHDSKTMGGLIVPPQHIGMHFAQWKKTGKPMPFAVAIGTDPVTPLVSSMGIPENMNEADIIGGYREKPLEVVRCETVDLYVPAASEIVIEGFIPIDETRPEGPFGEYTGYLMPGKRDLPVYRVTAITHRDDPILTAVCPGEPVEDHLSMSISLAGEVLAALRANGIPALMTYIPPEVALHFIAVSVDRSAYTGSDLIQKIGRVLWSTKAGVFLPKVIVMDRDVDPTDTNRVFWTLATRNHPGRGIVTFPDTSVFPLFPFLSAEEKEKKKCTTVIFDCTWPSDWPAERIPKRASFDSLWPPHIQSRVLENWASYGYPAP